MAALDSSYVGGLHVFINHKTVIVGVVQSLLRKDNLCYNSLQALWAWILEFEMSVNWICEFDPFWTKKNFLQKDRHSERRTDIEAQIVV